MSLTNPQFFSDFLRSTTPILGKPLAEGCPQCIPFVDRKVAPVTFIRSLHLSQGRPFALYFQSETLDKTGSQKHLLKPRNFLLISEDSLPTEPLLHYNIATSKCTKWFQSNFLGRKVQDSPCITLTHPWCCTNNCRRKASSARQRHSHALLFQQISMLRGFCPRSASISGRACITGSDADSRRNNHPVFVPSPRNPWTPEIWQWV